MPLQQADLTGRTVAPFWTWVTDQGTVEEDFGAGTQGGTVAKGLGLRSPGAMDDDELDRTLTAWLDTLPRE